MNRNDYINLTHPLQNVLLKFFGREDNLMIFDIGACEGEESIRYKKIFSNSFIYLFEPLDKNVQLIKENIKKFSLSEVKVFPLAMSNKSGSEKFYISSGQPNVDSGNDDWDFGNKSSSLLEPDQHLILFPWIKFSEKMFVETISMDKFTKDNNISIIDFIHLDVQGAELKVLEGAEESIINSKLLWLEVSKVTMYKDQPLVDEIHRFLLTKGFDLYMSDINGATGDQLYFNKRFFKVYNFLSFSLIKRISQY